jgi:hypothetical protein
LTGGYPFKDLLGAAFLRDGSAFCCFGFTCFGGVYSLLFPDTRR